jgi:hypothetical protein
VTTREKGLLLTGLILIWGTMMWADHNDQEDLQYQPTTTSGIRSPGQTNGGPQTEGFSLDKPLQTIALNTPRNIFAPLKDPNQPKPKIAKSRPKPKVQAPKSQPKASKPAPMRKPRTGPSPSDLAAQQAQQQLKKYTFLGYLTKEGEQQIFLSNGQAIYIVKQGETLEGDIQVKSIDPKAVVLSKRLKGLGETVEATLPLTKDGQKT